VTAPSRQTYGFTQLPSTPAQGNRIWKSYHPWLATRQAGQANSKCASPARAGHAFRIFPY
jgi:hypothetical protein